MFTGIVEERGTVVEAESGQNGFVLVISAQKTVEGSTPGDSISVNGTCLTITQIDGGAFSFGVAPESLARTNLGSLSQGDEVNLERSLTPESRMGGHFVQGHVDGTGRIEETRGDKESLWLEISASPDLLQWVVPKGYVALDGVSLTVVEVLAHGFTVMLVPYTLEHVANAFATKGREVNIEVDILGKYVGRILEQQLAGGSWTR